MTTRREFLVRGTAGVAAATLQSGCLMRRSEVRIQSAVRREDTLRRYDFDGDNFHMSWAADDNLYVALCDGLGYPDRARDLFNNRVFAFQGGPQEGQFIDLPGYPRKVGVEDVNDPGELPYYAFGTFAAEGRLYQYLSNMFRAVKLIYSPDNGRTWCNQNGSTPVVWEGEDQQSKQTMVFFDEPQSAFSLLSVLQMGRNYSLNKDGFIYVYAPNGILEGTMNELVMFRVPKAQLLNRSAYEFFAGYSSDGAARWSGDIHARQVVHTFPSGWVNKSVHPYAWHPSVTYNAPLGLYLMANWGMASTPAGDWFARPNYLGFWAATTPWGPWRQFHEEKAWMPGGDAAARAYQPQIMPKWIAPDGKSFWIAWTDFQHTADFWPALQRASASPNHEQYIRTLIESRKYRPYYSFNVQRVDLTVA